MKKEKDLSGTGLTEADSVSVSVPADAATARHTPGPWTVEDAAEMMSTDAGELEGDDAGYVAVTKESYDALMAAHRKAEGR